MPTLTPHTVFLTGATGFIGSHVAETFATKGIRVVCAVRESSDITFLETLGVAIKVTDFTDTGAMAQAMKGCSSIVHMAGLVNDWSTFEGFFEANVGLTMQVLHAARKAGIRQVITTGSNASYGEEHCLEVKSEDSPASPCYPYFLNGLLPNRLNHYRLTKYLATCEAIRFAKENQLNLTVLEPVWVYGEREFSSGFYEYMKVVSQGIPFFPGSKKNRFHVIYAGDVANAYYQAWKKKLPGVHRFLLGNEKAERMEDIYAVFCRELGVKKPLNLPKALIYPIALLMETLAECFRFKHPPLLSRSRVNMFYDNIEYNIDRAKKMLGFQQLTPLEQGIRRTVQWYKMNNLIG